MRCALPKILGRARGVDKKCFAGWDNPPLGLGALFTLESVHTLLYLFQNYHSYSRHIPGIFYLNPFPYPRIWWRADRAALTVRRP